MTRFFRVDLEDGGVEFINLDTVRGIEFHPKGWKRHPQAEALPDDEITFYCDKYTSSFRGKTARMVKDNLLITITGRK